MKHRWIGIALASLGALALAACGGGSSSADYGKSADPAEATRKIDVRILASKRYQPAAIGVKPGEIVTFVVTNQAAELHEFLLGDQKVQNDHEKTMAGMSSGSMRVADKPNLIDLDPGQTKELTWKFPTKIGATVIYGSHVPGDYSGGLLGTITVGEATGAPPTTGGPSTLPSTTKAGSTTTTKPTTTTTKASVTTTTKAPTTTT